MYTILDDSPVLPEVLARLDASASYLRGDAAGAGV
jgi:hypothetical protein